MTTKTFSTAPSGAAGPRTAAEGGARCARLLRAAALVPLLALSAGCTNLTGLIDAHDEFGCGVPGKPNCSTLSETYAAEHAAEEAAASREARAMFESAASAGAKPDAKADAEARGKTDVGAAAAPAGPAAISNSARRWMARARPRTVNEGLLRAQRMPQQLPARAPERVVMLWILPWVDAQGDLHSDSRVWVRVEDALWRIERVRSRAMQSARPAMEP